MNFVLDSLVFDVTKDLFSTKQLFTDNNKIEMDYKVKESNKEKDIKEIKLQAKIESENNNIQFEDKQINIKDKEDNSDNNIITISRPKIKNTITTTTSVKKTKSIPKKFSNFEEYLNKVKTTTNEKE